MSRHHLFFAASLLFDDLNGDSCGVASGGFGDQRFVASHERCARMATGNGLGRNIPQSFSPSVNPPLLPSEASVGADLLTSRDDGFDRLATYDVNRQQLLRQGYKASHD
jgi:hypothetical protein